MHKKMFFAVALGILSIVFSSCSIKYVPIQSADISITDDFAVLKKKDITFAVENKYWIKDPQNLTDYFTTFFVSIKNNTDRRIEINEADIVLLDEYENQYDVVSLDYIENLLLPKQIEFLYIDTIEQTDGEDSDRLQMLEKQKDTLEKWRESKKNLITYSLHFGTLHPGAQKSGFIFFPKLSSKNNKCKIIFRDNTIEFIRQDVKKKQEK
ncbi:MAG: hypothetical protein K9M95_07820 [Candidatus Cloacimonetes bacterium]|nr:hypothetical protein [Candidatus Cloacimonadota bacterium]MCF7884026.1 hypothetical protein [Candidatus Cloacimonadota bacterium]